VLRGVPQLLQREEAWVSARQSPARPPGSASKAWSQPSSVIPCLFSLTAHSSFKLRLCTQAAGFWHFCHPCQMCPRPHMDKFLTFFETEELKWWTHSVLCVLHIPRHILASGPLPLPCCPPRANSPGLLLSPCWVRASQTTQHIKTYF
jgi:hypothetical protein